MNLYLAGAEAHFDRLYDTGCRTMLMSYHYMSKKGVQDLGKRFKLDKREKINIMIDSGAFTFNAHPEDHTVEEITAYRDKYIKWLIKNKKWITTAVELDCTEHLDVKELERWRDDYFQPLVDNHGMQIVFVWHSVDKHSGWLKMCDKYKYVGLAQAGSWDFALVSKYIREARQRKTKTHGFAYTHVNELAKLEFTSCDSTTWLSGMKFGVTFIFTGHKLETYDKTQKYLRNKHKRKFIDAGINWKLVKLDFSSKAEKRRLAYGEVTKINILGWLELAKYVNKKHKQKRESRKAKKLNAKELSNSDSTTVITDNNSTNIGRSNNGPLSLLEQPGIPKLKCSSCHLSEECDKFDENRLECFYKIDDFDITDPQQLVDMRKILLKTDYQRLQRNLIFETGGGGYVDRSVQFLADKVFEKAGELEKDMRGGGATRSPFSANDNAQATVGAIGQIFGKIAEAANKLTASESEEAQIIDVTPEPSQTANLVLVESSLNEHDRPISPQDSFDRDRKQNKKHGT